MAAAVTKPSVTGCEGKIFGIVSFFMSCTLVQYLAEALVTSAEARSIHCQSKRRVPRAAYATWSHVGVASIVACRSRPGRTKNAAKERSPLEHAKLPVYRKSPIPVSHPADPSYKIGIFISASCFAEFSAASNLELRFRTLIFSINREMHRQRRHFLSCRPGCNSGNFD
jgi:hypothetical protein